MGRGSDLSGSFIGISIMFLCRTPASPSGELKVVERTVSPQLDASPVEAVVIKHLTTPYMNDIAPARLSRNPFLQKSSIWLLLHHG
jgi:hypothetical protein